MWNGAIELFHKLPFLAFATAMTTGAALTYWDSFSAWLGLSEHREWIGIVFIVATVLLVAQIASTIWSWLSREFSERQQCSRLKFLTWSEARVLKSFVSLKHRTINLYVRDESVQSLSDANVIKRVGHDTDDDGRTAYIIAEWAWRKLHRSPALLAKHDTHSPQ